MKKKILISFSILALLSCGKKSPFSEKYWENENEGETNIQEESSEVFNITLAPIISDQTLSGSVNLNLDQEKIIVQADLLNVPTNIDIVRFSVSALTCDEIRVNGPPAPISKNKYKDFSFNLIGNKDDFLNVLNDGKISRNNLVILGLYGPGLPGQANLVFPIACGPIRESGE